jgi:nucleotide-binding universal stress UspA family protein
MFGRSEGAHAEGISHRWREQMIRKILVAVDGSAHAARAAALAIDLAKACGAELVALNVTSDEPLTEGERRLAEAEYQGEVRRALGSPEFVIGPGATQMTVESLLQTSYGVGTAIRTAIGRHIVSGTEEDARQQGVTAVKTLLEGGDPASVIVQVAGNEKPDLLVMGSRGLGEIQGLLMGSVSHKVSHLAKCTVVIVK